MPGKKQIYTVLLILFIVITGISYSCSNAKQEQKEVGLESYLPSEDTKESTTSESSQAVTIFVHICGEVVNPGVYEVLEGARSYEVIQQAGGFTEFAARDYLNLAQLVKDGDKLIVPNLNELEKPMGEITTDGETTKALININQADMGKLMTLPGIGEAKATAIIKYREKAGGFKSIEEIMNISGIKEAAFAKIEEYITVN